MSAKFGGFQTPPPPLVSNGQHLLDPPSPLVNLRQHLAGPPSTIVFKEKTLFDIKLLESPIPAAPLLLLLLLLRHKKRQVTISREPSVVP